jgi:hypothetical protein
MIKACFRTQNGHYLIANDASSRYTIGATPDGVGPWELFSIIPLSRDTEVIRNGDKIRLQTHHGRYVMARGGGGGAVSGETTVPSSWETFTIENFAGGGEIAHGDLVTLRTDNGMNFLIARDGGGGVVTADSRNRAEWETLSVEFWNPILVRLKAQDSHYLAAENGGGREIAANRDAAITWETFTLVNRSRKSGLQDGDSVCLQVWDGRFVSAQSGGGAGLLANQNRAAGFETFTIQKAGGGEIGLSDLVSFRTQNGHYLMALNGGGSTLQASARLAREWETFQLEEAALKPIAYSKAPSAPVRAGHPFPTPLPRRTGNPKLICFVIGFEDREVDDSITTADLRDFFFNASDSVRTWIQKTSFNAYTISDVGVFGGLTVPWPYVEISEQDYFSGLLRLAETRGFRFRDMDTNHNGVITEEELLFMVLDCSNQVGLGQRRPISFTFDEIRYNGQKFTAGLYTRGGPVQGRAQLDNIVGTIRHELSHMLWELAERYYQPFPPRGDVVAISTQRKEWEKFALVSPGASVVRSGSRVRLQMQDGGDFLVFDATTRRHLNRGGAERDASGEFIIEKDGGGDLINHDDQVYLKAATTNRYLMANWGGGHVVQVIAGSPSIWETFKLERDAGAGAVHAGDVVTLKTSDQNVYGQSYYLMAEPDGRRNSSEIMARGWWEEWAKSPSGDGMCGDFDVMDNDENKGTHGAYDRIKLGWIKPKVLTPDNRACYVLNPSLEHPEAFILWDPAWPDEWYVIENRQRRNSLDEIPSNGLIISWVNEKASYWSQWKFYSNGKYPAVISAAATTAPPNTFIQLPLLRNEIYKRRDSNTAFRSGTYVLPRGDGSRSRFILSFRDLPHEQVEFCIL